MSSEMRIIGLQGLPDVEPGFDLAAAITEAAESQDLVLAADDVLVVTQKVVSKAEGQIVDLATVTPSTFADQIAKTYDKDPRVVEVVLRESRRIVKMDQGTIIAETHHGLVCANAGVDESNIAASYCSYF